MNKTLRALYEGEIFPAEQYLPKVEEYKMLHEKQYKHYADFVEKLGSPLDKEFKQIMNEQLDTLPLEFYQMFVDGFRPGAKMMIEIYEDESKNVNH